MNDCYQDISREDSKHDCWEKEFPDFKNITETRLNTSDLTADILNQADSKPLLKIDREFATSSYFHKGLLLKDGITDATGKKFTETIHIYLVSQVDAESDFPALKKTKNGT